MKTIGIIAEYNPFHNGHAYQIAEIKKRTGARHVIVAMSGDFVQRGAPALLDKYARTQMALSCGADLVLELPVLWATSSAESFAMAGITLFDKMGCVDGICFGAETGNLPLLSAVADILVEEPAAYKQRLSDALKNGASFPKARAGALCAMPGIVSSLLPHGQSSGESAALLSEVLENPNNILALEYLKALKRRRSPITPLLLKREGAGYHDTAICSDSAAPTASATAIRQLLLENPGIPAGRTGASPSSDRGGAISASASGKESKSAASLRTVIAPEAYAPLRSSMPPEVYTILCRYRKSNPLLREDDFSPILGYLLLRHAGEGFSAVADANGDIANRMKKNLIHFDSFSGFCAKNKSRDITYTRMSRILTHLLLGLTNEDYRIGRELDYIPYLRILGFCRDSSSLLRQSKENAAVPLISKLADAANFLAPEALVLLKQDIFAADLYEQVKVQKALSMGGRADFRSEYAREILRL